MADKKTLLLIHGYCSAGSASEKNWFPWLREAAQARGYRVLSPNLPCAPQLSYESWLAALHQLQSSLTAPLTIVGHSLGGLTACHLVAREQLAADRLIMVAPVGTSELDWEAIAPYGFDIDDKRRILDFIQRPLDLHALAARVEKTALYLSDNDPYIPLSVQDDYATLNPEVHVLPGQCHFSAQSGCTAIPELLHEL